MCLNTLGRDRTKKAQLAKSYLHETSANQLPPQVALRPPPHTLTYLQKWGIIVDHTCHTFNKTRATQPWSMCKSTPVNTIRCWGLKHRLKKNQTQPVLSHNQWLSRGGNCHGPVGRTPVNANVGLKVNQGFCFSCWKVFPLLILSYGLKAANELTGIHIITP